MKFLKNLVILIIFTMALVNIGDSSDFSLEKEDDHYHQSTFTSSHIRSELNPQELKIEYWKSKAQNYLKETIKTDPFNTPPKAKNIILFLGDGMSLATVAATRMYMGGEEKSLSFEKFPHFGLSKTYCVDSQVADSACSATAYLNGVKANIGTMGVTAKVSLGDCIGQNDLDAQTISIAKWAQNQCKATGVVTTSKITDASPAGLYAHIADRYWENDQEVERAGCNPSQTIDIARQLVENDVARHFKVILAGGRNEFRDKSVLDEENLPGNRGDKRDLIDEWIKSRNEQGKAAFVWNKNDMNNVSNDTEYLLGLFSNDHCEYNIDIKQKKLGEVKPMLSEMTVAAIKHLQKDPNGFFLFVESARIDMAHHDNWARIALDETKEFSKTIQLARDLTSTSDTLIVVTSDHAHTMTYNGYSKRGNDILGLSGDLGADNLTYSTLSYANGLGYYDTYDDNGGRVDVSQFDFTNPRLRYMATLPLKWETHGGEDVGIYASGPQSQLFNGNYEQSFIPLLMAYAGKIGPYAKNDKCSSKSNAASASIVSSTTTAIILLSVLKQFGFFF